MDDRRHTQEGPADRPAAPPVPSRRELVEPSQLRAIAHPERLRILRLFAAGKPLSVQEMASRLEAPHGRVHYHVHRLVDTGLLQEVGRREVNGIIERYYYPTASTFDTSRALAELPQAATLRRTAGRAIVQVAQEFVEGALARRDHITTSFQEAYLTGEEIMGVLDEFERLLERHHEPRPGARYVRFLLLTASPRDDRLGPAHPERQA